MSIKRAEEIPVSVHWCLLLVEFVSCNGRCNMCLVKYLHSRRKVASAC